MSKSATISRIVARNLGFGFIMWLGGAVHVANQPGYDFWDGIVWLYYVGRYFATHLTSL